MYFAFAYYAYMSTDITLKPLANMPFSSAWGRTCGAQASAFVYRHWARSPGHPHFAGGLADIPRTPLASGLCRKCTLGSQSPTWLSCVHHPPTGADERHFVHREDDFCFSVRTHRLDGCLHVGGGLRETWAFIHHIDVDAPGKVSCESTVAHTTTHVPPQWNATM